MPKERVAITDAGEPSDGRAIKSTACDRMAALASLVRAGFFLLAVALGAAVVRFQIMNSPLRPLRLAALTIGLALGAWRVRYGIIVLVFTAPLLGIIPRLADTPNLSLSEHLLIPLLLCGGVHLLWARSARARTAVDGPLAVYVTLVALSAARALSQYCTLGLPLWDVVGPQLNRHFLFTFLDFSRGSFLVVHYTIIALEGVLWFALLTAPTVALRASQLRAALVLSALSVALIGVAQSIWHFNTVPFFERMQPELHRINSTLPDPNTLGSFLVLILPLGVASALEWPDGGWLAAGWIGLLGYCLVRSVSRGAWIGFGVSSLALGVVCGWRSDILGRELPRQATRWIRRTLVLTVAIGGIALLLSSLGVVGRDVSYHGARSPLDMVLFTFNLRRPLEELLPQRMDHWEAAIKIWLDFPVFGAGIGKYVLLKGRYLPEARQRWMFFMETHNYYLKVLSELGLVGLTAFVVLLGSIGAQALQAWRVADLAGRRRVVAVAMGLCTFLLASLTSDPLTLREIQYIFWAVVALLVIESREAAPTGESGAARATTAGA